MMVLSPSLGPVAEEDLSGLSDLAIRAGYIGLLPSGMTNREQTSGARTVKAIVQIPAHPC
jgi:hypothetical protein